MKNRSRWSSHAWGFYYPIEMGLREYDRPFLFDTYCSVGEIYHRGVARWPDDSIGRLVIGNDTYIACFTHGLEPIRSRGVIFAVVCGRQRQTSALATMIRSTHTLHDGPHCTHFAVLQFPLYLRNILSVHLAKLLEHTNYHQDPHSPWVAPLPSQLTDPKCRSTHHTLKMLSLLCLASTLDGGHFGTV
jgi:hypothetical protein